MRSYARMEFGFAISETNLDRIFKHLVAPGVAGLHKTQSEP